MIACICYLHVDLPDVSSLKGRRSVLNGMKERLKHFNVSLLDISGEYPKEADIAFVFLVPDRTAAAQYRESIESMLESRFPQYRCELDYEEL